LGLNKHNTATWPTAQLHAIQRFQVLAPGRSAVHRLKLPPGLTERRQRRLEAVHWLVLADFRPLLDAEFCACGQNRSTGSRPALTEVRQRLFHPLAESYSTVLGDDLVDLGPAPPVVLRALPKRLIQIGCNVVPGIGVTPRHHRYLGGKLSDPRAAASASSRSPRSPHSRQQHLHASCASSAASSAAFL